MERVLVTGGAGFLGSHLVDAFIAQGDQVLVVDDLSSGLRENVHPKASLSVCDIRSAEAVKVIFDYAPTVLVHTAAQISVRRSMEAPSFDADVNVTALLRILQSFDGQRLPYLVFISTGGALYDEHSQLPASEQSPIGAVSIYGASKRAAEIYLEVWRGLYGLKFASLRPANIFGPRQNPHGEAGVLAIFNEAFLANRTPTIYGSGDQTRDFVFVGDVVNAVQRAIQAKYEGACNIGTAKETSINQIYELVAKSYGHSRPAQRAVGRPGEVMRSCLDPSLAKTVLGWSPTVDVEQGVALTCQWFKQRAAKAVNV